MDLSSGVIPEQASQLCSRELIYTVGFKGKGFEDGAWEVLPGARQGSGKLVW
jgi:hypothetical protein